MSADHLLLSVDCPTGHAERLLQFIRLAGWDVDLLGEHKEPAIRREQGRVIVSWPNGRGVAAVDPDVVEGWAEQMNEQAPETGDSTSSPS